MSSDPVRSDPTPDQPRRAGVLVDCDGTLLDTNYLHTLAWSRALRELGAWAPMHAIHRLVGMGGDQLVPELLGRSVEGADAAHTRHYEAIQDDMVAFPGARAFLEAMHVAGLTVVLASSAPGPQTERMRAVLDADAFIDGVVTGDDVEHSKPDPQIFAAACDRFGFDPSLVLAVGDSVWDVEAARAAGIACIALESGGFSRHELAEAGALSVYRDVRELGRQLPTSAIGALVPPH